MTTPNTNINSINKPSAMWRILMKIQNPFMKRMLRSPLHFSVSKMYMLIIFKGRKSGTIYTTPVQYSRQENSVYVITSEGYTWWKNLRGGADVELVIQRKVYRGHAETSTDPQIIWDVISKIYPSLKEKRKESFVSGKVAISITLSESQS